MGNHPTIQSIETISQLTAAGQPTFAVCLRMTGYPAVWSDSLTQIAMADLSAYRTTVQQTIAPHFIGQPLTAFRPLADQLDQLTETFTITEVTQPPAPADEGVMSRRRLISGFLAEDKPPAPIETVYTESRPIPSALRYVFNLLFLQAVAIVQQVTIPQLLRQEFGTELESDIVDQPKLHAAVSDPAVAAIVPELAGIWHTLSAKNIEKQLGPDNTRLQQYVRQLKEWLTQVTSNQPAICLDVRGGFGQLYNNNIGKILGAVYGLEHALKPYKLIIVDPLFDDDPFAQRKRLGDLKKYFGFRKLKTEIWVHRAVKAIDDIEPLAQSGAITGLQVDIAEWGSVSQIIAVMKTGRAAGLTLTLIYPPHIGVWEASLLQAIATFTQPDNLLITADLSQIYNQRQRQSHQTYQDPNQLLS